MANEGDYNFQGSALDRGVEYQPRETEDGYGSTLLDNTKIKTPEPNNESAVTLENTEGAETKKGDYNFEGSALERGVEHQPRETEDGYGSTFLDKTKIETPEPTNESAVTLENTEGAETKKGDYNFEGSALERGVEHQPRETEDGYGSTFLDKTKIETPEPTNESAVTLENTEGAETKKGDYNFEGSALERGVEHQPRETEDGYGSTFLDKTKIETPEPTGESAVTLENTEGAETRKGDYNFEGSALERGVEYQPKETEDGYGSTFLDKTKIETPEPTGESAVTLENTEGAETRKGDYNFEGSALERGVEYQPKETEEGYGSTFLDKTKIETPEPTGESAVTLENSGVKEEGSKYDEPSADVAEHGSKFLDETKVKTPEIKNEGSVLDSSEASTGTQKAYQSPSATTPDHPISALPHHKKEPFLAQLKNRLPGHHPPGHAI